MSNPHQYATGWHPCDKCGCLLPPSLTGPRCTDAAWCRLAKEHREQVEKDFTDAQPIAKKAGKK